MVNFISIYRLHIIFVIFKLFREQVSKTQVYLNLKSFYLTNNEKPGHLHHEKLNINVALTTLYGYG